MTEASVLDFDRVYEAYRGKVVGYATRLLGPEEADDVSQEVFLKIRRSLGTLSDPSKLTSWVYAITLNTARDLLRKRSAAADCASRGAEAPTADEKGAETSSGAPRAGSRTPEEEALRNEMVACYLDYVRQLSPNYHDVYVLSEFEGLSADEIAGRLSLTAGTVKIRLHRARTRLNAELRRNCRCYYNERGELMGAPKSR